MTWTRAWRCIAASAKNVRRRSELKKLRHHRERRQVNAWLRREDNWEASVPPSVLLNARDVL